MFDDFNHTLKILRETKAAEETLPLMAQTEGSRFFLQPHKSDRVCLFFHGFTATPEQFVPIGEAFFQSGYNVLIPLLPGHGMAGDWNGDNPPPLPENQEVYQDFGLHWLQLAQSLGKEVIVGGLSGSGTLVAWLALKCPEQIYRALAFAPYFSGNNKLVDWFVRTFNIYFKWITKPGVAHFGYEGFLMPTLRLFLEMGADILEQAQKILAAPMLIVSSESDPSVGNKEHEALFEAVLKFQPKSWYVRFDKLLDIPHNMMTVAEGNEYRDILIAIAKAFVESDLTWVEVEAICDHLKQGHPFNAAINELHLSERVAPELSAIMTFIDS